MPNKITIPQAAMPSSSHAYTDSGCLLPGINRGNSKLPRHMPPMNVPKSTPKEMAVEPITSCSICSHTIS
jgi:hypothetical protein